MLTVLILVAFIAGILYIMYRYRSLNSQSTPAHLSKEIEINEIYLSRAIQKNFFNLNKERLSKEDFQYIIDMQSDGQIIMFLTYIFERYYGIDQPNMKYIPFSTLIEDASAYSGYRLNY